MALPVPVLGLWPEKHIPFHSHVKRHFTWLHTYNLVVKWHLRRAYKWSNIAPKFLPSTAWVLMRCRSIRDNSAPSSGPREDVATLCRAYIRPAGTLCHFSITFFKFFNTYTINTMFVGI